MKLRLHNLTDRFIERLVAILVTIYLQRKINQVTSIINKGGRFKMKCTSKVGKLHFGITIKEVERLGTGTDTPNFQETTPFSMDLGIENSEGETEMSPEELKETLMSGERLLTEFRDKIATPLMNLVDKYADRATTAGEQFWAIKMASEQKHVDGMIPAEDAKALSKKIDDLEARVAVSENSLEALSKTDKQ